MVEGGIKFGTKAETLLRLKPHLRTGRILDLEYFTVTDWENSPNEVLERISSRFGKGSLVVRSSAQGEDGADNSMAGAYESILGVSGEDSEAIISAINDVVGSFSGDPSDQVLIQRMVSDVAVSGVIMTHDLENGSPYYVIDYDDESGRTDSVTAGDSINKTVLIYRDCDPKFLKSERVASFLSLARELESLCGGVPLDIEFGLANDGALYLFQVRRISLSSKWHPDAEKRVSRQIDFVDNFVQERMLRRPGILGKSTILGVMPDWNPAEILGSTPRPLAISLYRDLITRSVWTARSEMGYRDVGSEELMVVIGGQPYIDVRNSFNSFLPADVDDETGEILINAWLERLRLNPELHDKVEFEIAQTCYNFDFEEEFDTRYPNILSESQKRKYKEALQKLTNDCLDQSLDGSLLKAEEDIRNLQNLQNNLHKDFNSRSLSSVASHLDACRKYGTPAFVILARHGFIGESILRSAVKLGAISENRLRQFKQSVSTITSSLAKEYARVCTGDGEVEEFLAKYGHLRPGTYDITSFRYDERRDLFDSGVSEEIDDENTIFELTNQERTAIQSLLDKAKISSLDADGLLDYLSRGIAGREWGKFVFTKSLSDALATLTRWGEDEGISRDELSYLTWPDLERYLVEPALEHSDMHFIGLGERERKIHESGRAIKLGYLLRDVSDMYVIPMHRSSPNFIGAGKIEGVPVILDSQTSAAIDLRGQIVCIENADPGFDWIFTKKVGGLITKFGGANSHMAIRCAEFGLPAAIGCGEQMFRKMSSGDVALLDCDNNQLRVLKYD